MQAILKDLLDLQRHDILLREKRALLAAFPAHLADVEARQAGSRAELERARADQLNAFKERKRFELDVEQWKERARKYKDQTAQVKSNEAFRALQHEIQNAEEEVAKSEDRFLEQMIAGEEFDRRIKGAEKSLAEVEEQSRGERAAITRDQQEVRQEVERLEEERKTLAAAIPEDWVEEYDRIARHLHGAALAELRQEACSMCGGRVRPHVFQEMRSESEKIFHCELCNRILYYIEPPAPATAEPPPSATPATNPSVR